MSDRPIIFEVRRCKYCNGEVHIHKERWACDDCGSENGTRILYEDQWGTRYSLKQYKRWLKQNEDQTIST
jgi:ribosomal protein S27AE